MTLLTHRQFLAALDDYVTDDDTDTTEPYDPSDEHDYMRDGWDE